MLCEEKLEVFENGFEDGKFNLRVEFYGKDARKVLLAVIRELYVPEYGEDYVYPFECAKEFWGIPLEPDEIVKEEFTPKPVKFLNRAIFDRLEEVLDSIGVSWRPDFERIQVHRLKTGYLAVGKDFILNEDRGVLFTFSKPSAAGLILKYMGMLDEK
ncbi:PH1570 family protein [Thermococcus sp. Bubb.Bath]|uniref:PH1570 family protein n=1 Tax=Thermococcus sp. Bubb.Bath TaxID=1638242 RepID=UPI0014395450|nr:PH1570 family protein [Thermococcus sp. Bubb.Bath]NJF24689.1 hypothetical protein [Thermococcus sp. Bubb.Bath]